MERDTPFFLSLTGENSHKVKISAGQGRFVIGTKEITITKCDALVELEDKINWQVFNDFKVPAGGNWPRIMEYTGDDTSFIQWSSQRALECMDWKPIACKVVDFSNANIGSLKITISTEITVKLGKGVKNVTLCGDINKVELINFNQIDAIELFIQTDRKKTESYTLKSLPQLTDLKDLSISTAVKGQALDCSSLLQFKNLNSLALSGNICKLDALSSLTNLHSLELRYMPNLENLPLLTTWNKLNYFIGWNIESTIGKRVKKELNSLESIKEFKYASVSNLKTKEWFVTEYGNPFAVWKGNNGKIAVKAYKDCLKTLKKVSTLEEVKAAIVLLIQSVNKLPTIETEEREDTFEAVMQLAQMSVFKAEEDLVEQWFDEYREF